MHLSGLSICSSRVGIPRCQAMSRSADSAYAAYYLFPNSYMTFN